MQLIIALETKNKEGSDYFYLRALRKRFYIDRGTKITPVFLDGKGNYKNIENKVKKCIKDYSIQGGESKVVYFLDVDSDSITGDQRKLNKEITEYCLANNIELVWFRKDIEHVMLGKRVNKSQKTQLARNFFAQSKIDSVQESELSVDVFHLKDKQSNVLKVLDKYFDRKA